MSSSLQKNVVRVRIAPSPTGSVHIGSLRTALYNYLFARQNGGQFIIRIEDTDRVRLVEGALEEALKMFAWAGLDWDEGPALTPNPSPSGRGERSEASGVRELGNYGPYIQSERLDIYKKYAQELLDKGHAYHCFCTPQELEIMRNEQQAKKQVPRYDGRCKNLSAVEIEQKLNKNVTHVLRLKVTENKIIEFDDIVYGKIKVNSNDIDDQVLMKSDGFPTYHLAVVIDDHLMQISHILRGEEWLPSTPKHILLYQAFDWQTPIFCHLPNILGDNKKKLSKRTGDVSVEAFQKQGYLPQALINYIALLGWNPGTEQETFSLDELIKKFDIAKLHKAGAVFDYKKLDNINGQYLRKLSVRELSDLCRPYLETEIKQYGSKYAEAVVALEQGRLKKLKDIEETKKIFFTEKLEYEPKFLLWKKSNMRETKEKLLETKEKLMETKEKLMEVKNWDKDNLEKEIFDFIKNKNYTNGEVLWPLRVALSGQQNSPGPFDIAAILGKDESLKRIEWALTKL